MVVRIWVCLIAVIAVLSASPIARAVPVDMRLEITPQPCTLDILSTGVSQQMIVQPIECQQIPQVQERANHLLSGHVVAPRQTPPQASLLETAVLQPLASMFGFGESHGSPVRPITTSVTFIAVMGFAVDAAFFERWTTRRITRVIRGTMKKFYALVGGVLRR